MKTREQFKEMERIIEEKENEILLLKKEYIRERNRVNKENDYN